jgi:1-acyl-sn-glycerol-3-phosphate acyltransferase
VSSTIITPLSPGVRRQLALQRLVARLLAPVTVSLISFTLYAWFGFRVKGVRELRRRYRELCLEQSGPMMICANHLTKIDSLVIACALGSPWWYIRHPRTVPWNVPEKSIFGTTLARRMGLYAIKCIPIERGGNRPKITEVLSRLAYTLSVGEPVLVFAEGKRSRSGRVEMDSAAAGIGRVYRSLPDCRVLCVYLRGDRQESYSDTPVRGEQFRGLLSVIEPKSDQRGLRGSLDIAQQITRRLVEMEQEYFDRWK